MTARHKRTFFPCFPATVKCFLILSFLNTSTRGSLTIMGPTTQNSTSLSSSIFSNPCLSFEEGDVHSNTFYSPSYPSFYPNSTICIRLIEAEPDKVVRLKFIDFFEIEPTPRSVDCKYDFLEVRDGRFEYSRLMGKLCGYSIPQPVISSSRYLWLRFRSDTFNQHRGFKISYSFLGSNPVSTIDPVGVRYPRELLENPCSPFDEGDPTAQIFYSPNYPNTYPSSMVCERTIEAEPEKIIRVDFLDFFEVEPATTGYGCPNDFLEVRDGKFGYSNLIGKFCGRNKFPSHIISSGRYLWLRFTSDENIQYSGFKAAYTFIDKPATVTMPELERCYMEVGGIEGFIVKTDIEEEIVKKTVELNIPLDCMWKVIVDQGFKIQLYFETFELGKPNECDSNYIEIYPEKTDEPSRQHIFCGSIAEERITSETNVYHVRFMADSRAFNKTNFKILYTSYRESKTVPCREEEYDCQDYTCISMKLKCNENVNCRYRWDETECEVEETAFQKLFKDKRKIVILIIFFFILTGMCFSFIYNCIRKLVRDHKIIQENKRKSRESRLDQLGRKAQSVQQLSTMPKVLPKRHASLDSSERSTSPELHMSASVTMLHQSSLPSSHYTPKPVDLIPIMTESKGCGTEDTSSHDDPPDRDNSAYLQGRCVYGNMHDDDIFTALPQMRDSECQTRESLFQNVSYTPNSSGDGSLTPPPLPHLTGSHKSSSGIRTLPSVNSRSTKSPGTSKSPGTFTTFGYNRNNQKPQPPPRYRAEAVIEVEKSRDKSGSADARPFSVQSTKSAPDVIFTH